jgi:hypothetical protein
MLGAGEGNRTPDPRITNALLYQLSYPGGVRDYTGGSREAQDFPLLNPWPASVDIFLHHDAVYADPDRDH